LLGRRNLAYHPYDINVLIETREYFYSVIFEISDKQMQFAELNNTPKQKQN
jgi:hypothetical protein